MTREYFYFIASLPMITSIETACPMSVAAFMEQSRQLLHPEDFADLEQVMAEDGRLAVSGNPHVVKIADENRNFRNAMAWFRATRAGRDPLDYLREDRFNDPFWADIAGRASKMPDLLEAERLIDRTRWQVLEDLITGHFFDAVVVFVYGLKLGMLERYREIRSEKGPEMLGRLLQMDTLTGIHA